MVKRNDGFVIKLSGKDVLDLLNKIDDKVDQIHVKTAETNGKVKLHTKLIWSIGGVMVTLFGILLAHIAG